MAHLDIPLTVAFFLIITGILTWTAFAIIGVWHVFGVVEKLIDRITRRDVPVRIYPHR